MKGVPSEARSGPCENGWEKGVGNPFPPEPEGAVPGSPPGPVSPGGAPDATRTPTRCVGTASTYGGADPALITPEIGDSPDGGCQGCCELEPAAACAGFGDITPVTESTV